MKDTWMKKVFVISVILFFIGAAITPIIHFTNVKAVYEKERSQDTNQKELLFQTILNIANNKEIQKIILNSEIRREGFFSSGARFSRFSPQVLTKNHLRQMYLVGLILSKAIRTSRIHSMVEQLKSQGIQNEINTVIEKDATLREEMTRLSSLQCDCGNDSTVLWHFPVLCLFLIPFIIIGIALAFHGSSLFGEIIVAIASALHCNWLH
jgi:hypothetical protein